MKSLIMNKKQLFVIKPHSIIDVITNSSTELFIIPTDKTVEFVKEILQEAINLHNKTNGTSYTFDEIFEEPYVGSSKDALNGWEDYYKSNLSEGIILSGASDNSIPYWMFDFIEYAFGYKTERFHLG